MLKFIDTYNSVVGAAIVVLTSVFGKFWFLFALFWCFNLLDWLSGWHKAAKQKQSSSKVGFLGAVKKLGYWAILAVAFAIPLAFQTMGEIIGIDLEFLQLIGWLTLASLMVNEVRSILENLVETGYNVPFFLIKGLAITDKLINNKVDWNENQRHKNKQ